MTKAGLQTSPNRVYSTLRSESLNLITLLVPGFPSLDAKLYSPGVTQRKEFSDLMSYRSGDWFSAFAKSVTR
jgi:hypothetical protein